MHFLPTRKERLDLVLRRTKGPEILSKALRDSQEDERCALEKVENGGPMDIFRF